MGSAASKSDISHPPWCERLSSYEQLTRGIDLIMGRNEQARNLGLAVHLLQLSREDDAARIMAALNAQAEAATMGTKLQLESSFFFAAFKRVWWSEADTLFCVLAASLTPPGSPQWLSLVREAVDLDVPVALSMLGDEYRIAGDLDMAQQLYERAAAAGDGNAMCQFGIDCLHAVGDAKRQAEAVAWLMRASDEANWVMAQDLLARYYKRREILTHIHFLCLASRNGSQKAQEQLAALVVSNGNQKSYRGKMHMQIICQLGRSLKNQVFLIGLFGNDRFRAVVQNATYCCNIYARSCRCASSLLCFLACVRFGSLPVHKDVVGLIAELVWSQRFDIAWSEGAKPGL